MQNLVRENDNTYNHITLIPLKSHVCTKSKISQQKYSGKAKLYAMVLHIGTLQAGLHLCKEA